MIFVTACVSLLILAFSLCLDVISYVGILLFSRDFRSALLSMLFQFLLLSAMTCCIYSWMKVSIEKWSEDWFIFSLSLQWITLVARCCKRKIRLMMLLRSLTVYVIVSWGVTSSSKAFWVMLMRISVLLCWVDLKISVHIE